MAKIAGKDVTLEISTDTGTTWKKLICEIRSGIKMTRETQRSPLTKCDTATSAQSVTPLGYSWTFDFDALVDTAPSSSQVTYADLLTLFTNGTEFMVRHQYDNTGSEFYTAGTALITDLNEDSPADGYVGCTGTVTGSGALDIAA